MHAQMEHYSFVLDYGILEKVTADGLFHELQSLEEELGMLQVTEELQQRERDTPAETQRERAANRE